MTRANAENHVCIMLPGQKVEVGNRQDYAWTRPPMAWISSVDHIKKRIGGRVPSKRGLISWEVKSRSMRTLLPRKIMAAWCR